MISLNQSHVEVTFSVGQSSVRLFSLIPVKLGFWHSLQLRRYHRDVFLRVDHDDPLQGRCDYSRKMNIGNFSYLGGMQKGIGGLRGCIKKLRFAGAPEIERLYNVGECKED